MIEPRGRAFGRIIAGFALTAALSGILAGCERGDPEAGAARTDNVVVPQEPNRVEVAGAGTERQAAAPPETRIELGTFTPAVEDSAEVDFMADRLPGTGGAAILIPATTLFPGSARLDPGIENPFAGDPEAIAAGERHFKAYNCVGCHMPMGGGGMGPPLSDDVWIYGAEPAQIYLSIMHGRPQGMPQWSGMLPSKVVWEMIAYIDTLNEINDYAAAAGFDGTPPWPTTGSAPGGSENGGDASGGGGSESGDGSVDAESGGQE